MTQRINIVLFGIGNAGSALINKVIKSRKELAIEQKIDIRFPIITNSTVAFYEKEGINYSWEANFIQFGIPFRMDDVLNFVKGYSMENLIAIDATASAELPNEYFGLLQNRFNIISINDSLKNLPANFGNGLKFLADSRGLDYKMLPALPGGKGAIAEKLFEQIISIAEKQKALAS